MSLPTEFRGRGGVTQTSIALAAADSPLQGVDCVIDMDGVPAHTEHFDAPPGELLKHSHREMTHPTWPVWRPVTVRLSRQGRSRPGPVTCASTRP